MVEKARRGRIEDDRDPAPEWEVFVRDDGCASLRHVGSVLAGSADEAHERASRLFGWYAEEVWLCPSGEVVRYATGAADADVPGPSGREPRVRDELEGTPRATDRPREE